MLSAIKNSLRAASWVALVALAASFGAENPETVADEVLKQVHGRELNDELMREIVQSTRRRSLAGADDAQADHAEAASATADAPAGTETAEAVKPCRSCGSSLDTCVRGTSLDYPSYCCAECILHDTHDIGEPV